MPSTTPSPSRISFGLYEVDLQAGELWRSGYRVKLQSQPFKVLTILLERPGEVVTREELQMRLWGTNTIVDFDHSLATAINKIREALRDSADDPRFVETLARRGYRFIAPVHLSRSDEKEDPLSSGAVTVAEDDPPAPVKLPGTPRPVHITTASTLTSVAPVILPAPQNAPSPEVPARSLATPEPVASLQQVPRPHILTSVRWLHLILPLLIGCLLAVGGYLLGKRHAVTVPPHIVQLSHSGHLAVDLDITENLVAGATDGYRLFVPVVEGGQSAIVTVPTAGGSSTTFDVPEEVASPVLGDISPDGTQLLLRNHLSPESEQPLWVVPSSGASALRVDRVLAHDATWMPDGKGILYATGNSLYVTRLEGGGSQLFASLPGRAFWLRWNPAGNLLRFTMVDPIAHTRTLWQLTAIDHTPRQLLTSFMETPVECCGVWTADGKWFVFQASRDGHTDLWKLAGKDLNHPSRVTDGPLQFQSPLPARQGDTLYAIGVDSRSEMKRLTAEGTLVPERGFLASALRVEFSRDRKWVAWTDGEGHLWRAAADGTQRLRLTPDKLGVFLARWSPDGSRLAFMAREPGKAWQLYLVDADGGEIRPLLRESRNAADPSWSADGKSLAFGRVNDTFGRESATRNLEIVHLESGAVEPIPHSEDLFSPRWSPDGRYLAALSLDQRQVRLFEFATRQWTTLPLHSGADPVWSPDSRFLYVHEPLDPAQSLDRVTIPEGAVQALVRLNDSAQGDVQNYVFGGLTAAEEPLIVERVFTGNLYSLQLK